MSQKYGADRTCTLTTHGWVRTTACTHHCKQLSLRYCTATKDFFGGTIIEYYQCNVHIGMWSWQDLYTYHTWLSKNDGLYPPLQATLVTILYSHQRFLWRHSYWIERNQVHVDDPLTYQRVMFAKGRRMVMATAISRATYICNLIRMSSFTKLFMMCFLETLKMQYLSSIFARHSSKVKWGLATAPLPYLSWSVTCAQPCSYSDNNVCQY